MIDVRFYTGFDVDRRPLPVPLMRAFTQLANGESVTALAGTEYESHPFARKCRTTQIDIKRTKYTQQWYVPDREWVTLFLDLYGPFFNLSRSKLVAISVDIEDPDRPVIHWIRGGKVYHRKVGME